LRTHRDYSRAAFVVRFPKNFSAKREPALTFSGYAEGVPVLVASLARHLRNVKT
jgi:hypothetical protein